MNLYKNHAGRWLCKLHFIFLYYGLLFSLGLNLIVLCLNAFAEFRILRKGKVREFINPMPELNSSSITCRDIVHLERVSGVVRPH